MKVAEENVADNNLASQDHIADKTELADVSADQDPKSKNKQHRHYLLVTSVLVVLVALLVAGGFLYYSGYFNKEKVADATHTLGNGFIEPCAHASQLDRAELTGSHACRPHTCRPLLCRKGEDRPATNHY